MSSGGPTPSLSPPSAQDKGKGRERKRGLLGGGEPSATRRRTREPSPPDENENGTDAREIDRSVYDPDQTLEERRVVQSRMRAWQQHMHENPDEYLADDTKILQFLHESTKTLDNVKQTGEAAIDARSLVTAADLSSKRVQRLLTGGVANGIDVDEFTSKVITFMLRGGGIEDDDAPELSSTQRRRRQGGSARNRDDDEEAGNEDFGDDGDMFNWLHCGRYACLPSIRRPALSGFLLGPLSVEKKARKVAARSAPLRIDNLTEVRPEILDVDKLKRDKEDDLVTMARHIHKRLKNLEQNAQDEVEAALEEMVKVREPSDAEIGLLMDKFALRDTGGIDLVKFVVNPHSFGQTVENIFYVSFLIREGTARLEYDKYGLPTLATVEVEKDPNVKPDKTVKRNQAFMSIDMETWKNMIETFDIKTSLIPHRQENVRRNLQAGQWYS